MKWSSLIVLVWILAGCVEHPSAVESSAVAGARSPIVAATTFVAIVSSSSLLESDLSENHAFASVVGDSLLKEIREFESSKRKLCAYPRVGWSEASEELLRRFSRGSPVTGFLDFQNPMLDENRIAFERPNRGAIIMRAFLRINGGGRASCKVILSENSKGWVVEDFYSEGSSARKRLAEETKRIRVVLAENGRNGE